MNGISENLVASFIWVLLGTVATLIWKKISKYRHYVLVTESRRRQLEGRWSGKALQAETGSYEFDIILQAGRKKISGSGTLKGPRRMYILFEGGYRNDRFLELMYRNEKDEVIQFGTLIFELHPESSKLKGRFVGYGPLSEKLVSGEVEMEKIR
jgi:hypothetical protein